METRASKKINICSWLVATMMMFNSLCLLVNGLFPSLQGFGDVLVMLMILVFFFVFVQSMTIKINTSAVFLGLTILMLAILSWWIIDDPQGIVFTYVRNYVIWGLFSMLLFMQECEIRKILDISLFYSMWTLIVGFISIGSYLARTAYVEKAMVWTYAIFPCIAVAAVHYMYCRHNAKWWMRFTYILGIAMLIVFVGYANRGGFVSLLCLAYLILIKGMDAKKRKLKNRVLLHAAFIVCFVIAFVYFEEIIIFVYDFLTVRGIQISSVDKMVTYMLLDNITNNRDALYEYATQGFMESPLYGNGIGAFAVNHGGWPHNFFLQLLYEGGIFLAGLVLIPFINYTVKIFRAKTIKTEEYSMFVILFSASVPRLLFSTEIWNVQLFWLLLGFYFWLFSKSRQASNTPQEIRV